MKLFEKNIFSRPIFQPFTIYTKSSILDIPLCSEYASGTINYFRHRLHLEAWLGSRYISDMFKERQKLQKICKGVIFWNAAAKTKKWFLRNFWEKLYWETFFFKVVFSKFCTKSRSSHQRCSIKKAVLNKFAIFTGKHLCQSLFLIKL